MAVTGRLRQNSWTTADGQKRSKMGVVADGVIFLDRPKAQVADGSDEDAEPRSAQPGRYRKRTA